MLKKTILITGNSGYIGSNLSAKLNSKYTIIGLDLKEPKVNVNQQIYSDIRQTQSLNFKIDAVIHLAGLVKVSESMSSPVNYYNTNLIGTLNLLTALKSNCKNFIFASTGSAEYCSSPYSISKKAAEDSIIEICKSINLPYTIFRFYNIIGTCGNYLTNCDSLFYNLLRAKQRGIFTIFGNDFDTRDGTAERDYIHIEEICHAIEKAIEVPANSIENLGHGKGFTVKELVNLFKEVNDCNFDVLYGPRRIGDLDKTILSNPSAYLKTIYNIKDLVKIPTYML